MLLSFSLGRAASPVGLQKVLFSVNLNQLKPQAGQKSACCDHSWSARKSWHRTLRPARRGAAGAQQLALQLHNVAAEAVDVEGAPRAVAAVRDREGARAQREHARARGYPRATLGLWPPVGAGCFLWDGRAAGPGCWSRPEARRAARKATTESVPLRLLPRTRPLWAVARRCQRSAEPGAQPRQQRQGV